MDFAITFLKLFFHGLYLAAPLWGFLALVVVLLGQWVGRRESWKRGDALYWSFITATTVGYGDLRPSKPVPRALSVVIAMTGLVFSGIVVAIAVQAAAISFERHIALENTRATKQAIETAP